MLSAEISALRTLQPDDWRRICGAWSSQGKDKSCLNRKAETLRTIKPWQKQYLQFFRQASLNSVQHIFHMFGRNMALLICKQLLSTVRDIFWRDLYKDLYFSYSLIQRQHTLLFYSGTKQYCWLSTLNIYPSHDPSRHLDLGDWNLQHWSLDKNHNPKMHSTDKHMVQRVTWNTGRTRKTIKLCNES